MGDQPNVNLGGGPSWTEHEALQADLDQVREENERLRLDLEARDRDVIERIKRRDEWARKWAAENNDHSATLARLSKLEETGEALAEAAHGFNGEIPTGSQRWERSRKTLEAALAAWREERDE